MELVSSKVKYDSVEHKYYYNGVEISGLTKHIKRLIFPDQYDGIPKSVLDKAKDYGHLVHEICEIVDAGFDHPSIEAQNYLSLLEKYQLRHIASEYLVNFGKVLASPIDKVYQTEDCQENEFILADVKTTYVLNIPYLEWQLSTYAYVFEKLNKGAKVKKLLGIWLRREEHAEVVEITRIPDVHIKKFLNAVKNDAEFVNEYQRPDDNLLPAHYADMEMEIAKLTMLKEQVTKQCDEIKEAMMRAMVKAGAYHWEGSNISVTRKKDSTRKNFDKARFEKEHPELYRQYVSESPVVGSVTINVNKQFKEDNEIQFITSLRGRTNELADSESR
jgi:hypothetical protein